MLMTMGLQRETAGRGTMGTYIQVCRMGDTAMVYSRMRSYTDNLRHVQRPCVFPRATIRAIHHWHGYYHVICHIRCRTFSRR